MLATLPNEIVVEIASYLRDDDYISLANISKKFLSLLISNKRNVVLSTGYNASFISIKTFLTTSSDFSVITTLDFGNCYWFEPFSLTELIVTLAGSLKKLYVHGTQLRSNHLKTVLQHCTSISDLSTHFFHEDTTFWNSGVEPPDSAPGDAYISNSVFCDIKSSLKNLVNLSLHGDVYSFIRFSNFLCLCAGLEGVHFEMHSTGRVLELSEVSEVQPKLAKFLHYLPSFNNLRRVTGRIYNSNFMTNFFLASYVKETILERIHLQRDVAYLLDVLWIPHGGVKTTLPFFSLNGRVLITPESSDDVFKLQDLNSLCIKADARLSIPHMLRKATGRFPQLKMISCPYIAKDFVEFARSHKQLKVVQFHSFHYHDKAGPELAEGLGFFSQLEQFSIDPRFFRSPSVRIPPAPTGESRFFNLTVLGLVDSCPLLNEVEIGVFANLSPARYDREDYVCKGDSSALRSFSRCANLKRLTLANIQVDQFDFLSEILSSCSWLESLRLTNISTIRNSEKFIASVVGELKIGLQSSANLQDFRWEVGKCKDEFRMVCGQPKFSINGPELFGVLQLCRSLRRFAIIADRDVQVVLPADVKTFDWPWPLVLACFISPNIDWESIPFKINSAHPAFQSYVGSTKIGSLAHISPVHYNEMVLFDFSVGKLPYSPS